MADVRHGVVLEGCRSRGGLNASGVEPWVHPGLLHRAADVTLVTSHALGKELAAFKCALGMQ